jgi:hypothetical protein
MVAIDSVCQMLLQVLPHVHLLPKILARLPLSLRSILDHNPHVRGAADFDEGLASGLGLRL